MLNAGTDQIVTIKNKKESRSDAQHRLRWMWFTQLEKQLAGVGRGRDKKGWNLHFKHKFVPEILIAQDEDYVAVFDVYKESCKALQQVSEKALKQYQKGFWDRVISTKDMSVKSMARWLDAVDKYVLQKYQVVLITPDDLRWLRE